MSDVASTDGAAPSAVWDRAIEQWGNPAVFRLTHQGRNAGHVRFLYPGPTRMVWRRFRRVWEIAPWDVVHMVAVWELDEPEPWEGDPRFGVEYFFERSEIADLMDELGHGRLSHLDVDLGVAPVVSIEEKRRLIADVFDEGHLEGLPGTAGW